MKTSIRNLTLLPRKLTLYYSSLSQSNAHGPCAPMKVGHTDSRLASGAGITLPPGRIRLPWWRCLPTISFHWDTAPRAGVFNRFVVFADRGRSSMQGGKTLKKWQNTSNSFYQHSQDHELSVSVWRNPKSEQTESKTFFRYQFFSIPNPILFFDTLEYQCVFYNIFPSHTI